MDEWWETDAHDVTIDKVCRANLKQKITGSWRMRALTVKAILLNLQAKSRSEASVEAHYDIGNDLYTRMLDERMVYLRYWKNATTLAEAHEAKRATLRKAAGRAYGAARVPSGGFDEPHRSPPAYQKVLKDIREAVSDRGRGVRSKGERPPTRGHPEPQEMIFRCSTWFP